MEVPKELSPCVKKALSRLSMGDLTAGEMLVYLSDPRRKNTAFPKDTAERAVSLLVQEGFLDDKRYLKLILHRLDGRLLGPRRIREELTRRRFPPRYIEAAMGRRVDFSARAKALLEKRPDAEKLCASLPGRKKIMDALVRQGYDYSTARYAVEEISQETENFSE